MKRPPHPDSKTPTLLGLIGEWRALAGEQTDAIQRKDWPGMARLGHAKEKLKQSIDVAIAALGTDPVGVRSHALRAAAEELVRLEQSNSHLLTERSQQIRGRLEQSRAETRRLRLIRAAYCRARQTRWHSYL